jgi:hypothetical protein
MPVKVLKHARDIARLNIGRGIVGKFVSNSTIGESRTARYKEARH